MKKISSTGPNRHERRTMVALVRTHASRERIQRVRDQAWADREMHRAKKDHQQTAAHERALERRK